MAPVSDTANNSNPRGGIGGFFDTIFGPIIDNITAAIDAEVDDLQGQIASNLIKGLGLKDVYNLYLSKACEGDFDTPGDPKSDVTITNCVDYEDRQHGKRHIPRSKAKTITHKLTRTQDYETSLTRYRATSSSGIQTSRCHSSQQ